MKKQKIFFILLAVLLPFYQAVGQQLEKIPGQDSANGDLIKYLDNLYKFGISITGILAVFMIALGAFSYIVTSAGNTSKMMNAKEMITNALIGLVIALTAYLFLYVINPDLVGGTLEAPAEIVGEITNDDEEDGLSDGTSCDDGSESPSCPDCPSCSTCEDGYHINEDEEAVCGPSPSATADPDAIGCCEYDFVPSKECEASISKSDCESKPGGHIFHLGTGYSCVDAPGIGTGDECVIE